tara:strand:+ start:122 stop:355 length:234 start_codon:yes stop_codon:yes gene_type:complete
MTSKINKFDQEQQELKASYKQSLKNKAERIRMNTILNEHADWLDDNISKVEGKKCREQAVQYAKKDLRQKGVRKNER